MADKDLPAVRSLDEVALRIERTVDGDARPGRAASAGAGEAPGRRRACALVAGARGTRHEAEECAFAFREAAASAGHDHRVSTGGQMHPSGRVHDAAVDREHRRTDRGADLV